MALLTIAVHLQTQSTRVGTRNMPTPNLTLKLELVGVTTTCLEAETVAATVTRSKTLKLTTMIWMDGMQEEAAE
jgi:hypothetical protein